MFIRNKIGDTIYLVVYDCFAGDVKLLKRGWRKIYVEIVDACMLYQDAQQLQAGEKMWIYSSEICKDITKWQELKWKFKKSLWHFFHKPFLKKDDTWEDDLPF